MKRLIALAVCLLTILALLAGCCSTAVVRVSDADLLASETESSNETETETTPETDAEPETDAAPVEGAVKTGLSVSVSLSSSTAATADAAGNAQADVTLVAVTVSDEGVITDCVIDAVQTKVAFDASGAVTGELPETVLSKNELGADYGMGKYSAIGKEWNEQVQALADYVTGKTVEEIQGIAISETGGAADADLAASCSIAIAGFLGEITKAVENAQHLGAMAGDTLTLTHDTSLTAAAASTDAEGKASTATMAAAVTMNGETITSCAIDAIQADVTFDTTGAITTDLSAQILSKNQLGDDYGMGKISAIGKEWYEQAAAFAQYCTGKTVADITGMAVTETGGAADADLAASCSIAIGGFQTLIAKVAQ